MKAFTTPYFDDRLLRLIGIPLIGFVIPFFFFNLSIHASNAEIFKNIGMSSMYTFVFWSGSRIICFHSVYAFPKLEHTSKRLIYQNILGVSFVLITDYLLKLGISSLTKENAFENPSMVVGVAIPLLFFFLVQSIYEGTHYFIRLRKSLEKTAILEKERAQSQLQALKNQVNPHFLFNSLNTLSSIILESPELATRFVDKLSKVYRYILEMQDKQLIPLHEELACVEAYLFMLKIRFGEHLKVNMEIPEEAKQQFIIPLALQMLVENALKHNIVSRKRPLQLDIQTKGNSIIVRNSLQPKQQVEASTKVGLSNLRRRYELLTQQDVEVIVTEEYFTVVLPLVEVKEFA